MDIDLLTYFASYYDVPVTRDAYARRLRGAGYAPATASTIAAGAFPPAAMVERADTAVGAGWTVLTLCADGTAEPLARAGDYGAAADIAVDYWRTGASVVTVPTYDEHAFLTDRYRSGG